MDLPASEYYCPPAKPMFPLPGGQTHMEEGHSQHLYRLRRQNTPPRSTLIQPADHPTASFVKSYVGPFLCMSKCPRQQKESRGPSRPQLSFCSGF